MGYNRQKHPDEDCEITFNFSNLPEFEAGADIDDIEFIRSTPEGIEFDTDNADIDNDAKKVVVLASGGTDGEDYLLECKVTFDGTLSRVRSGKLRVRRLEG